MQHCLSSVVIMWQSWCIWRIETKKKSLSISHRWITSILLLEQFLWYLMFSFYAWQCLGDKLLPLQGQGLWALSHVLADEVCIFLWYLPFLFFFLTLHSSDLVPFSWRFVIGPESPAVDANGNAFDLSTKLLHLAWHPTENSLACAAANSLYMYFA